MGAASAQRSSTSPALDDVLSCDPSRSRAVSHVRRCRRYRRVRWRRRGGGDNRLELDVLAAAAELESRGAEDVVVIGASKGGTAAIAAGAADGSGIDGVVSLSAVASYQDTDAVRAAGSLAVPTLLVVAEDDGGPAEDAVEIEAACACENLELLTVPSSRHGAELVRSTDAGAREVNRRVLEFLGGIG